MAHEASKMIIKTYVLYSVHYILKCQFQLYFSSVLLNAGHADLVSVEPCSDQAFRVMGYLSITLFLSFDRQVVFQEVSNAKLELLFGKAKQLERSIICHSYGMGEEKKWIGLELCGLINKLSLLIKLVSISCKQALIFICPSSIAVGGDRNRSSMVTSGFFIEECQRSSDKNMMRILFSSKWQEKQK